MIKKLCFGLALLVGLCLSIVSGQSLASSTKEPVIWAFADVHGAYDELVALLQSVQLIDEQLNWSGDNQTLISTGDLVDRGPSSRKVLDLLMRLETQAISTGGKLEILLGNHEVMALVGNLKYVSREEYAEFAADETDAMREQYFQQWLEYQKFKANNEQLSSSNYSELKNTFEKLHPRGVFARFDAFSPNGVYGRWLLQKSVVLLESKNLFMHGGVSPVLQGETLASLNKKLHGNLVNYINAWRKLVTESKLPLVSPFNDRFTQIQNTPAEEITAFEELQKALLFSKQSPNWYRGAVYCHPYYEQVNLNQRLKQFNAQRLFVGHSVTPSKRVERSLEKVYLLDTGMLQSVYHGDASIAKIEPQSVTIYNSKGEQYNAADFKHRTILYPTEIPFTELEEILKSGEIAQTEKLTTGISEPYRLTFSDPRARVRALFKTIDTAPGIEKRRTRDSGERYADRYLFDIAAYRLSELLDFHLVPLSVEREINGVKGVVQYWVEDSYNEYTAEQNGDNYQGYCDYQAQRNLMNIYDLLVYNKDRNATNIIVEQHQGQLIWIDHSRSFSIHNGFPDEIDRSHITIPPSLRPKLEALDGDQLKEVMEGLLNRDQIKALLRRRNKILRFDNM